jgi:hypothetical protein
MTLFSQLLPHLVGAVALQRNKFPTVAVQAVVVAAVVALRPLQQVVQELLIRDTAAELVLESLSVLMVLQVVAAVLVE